MKEENNQEKIDINLVKKILKNKVDNSKKKPQRKTTAFELREIMEQPIIGYKVLEKMGRGGSGVVFKAQNITTKEIVAIKLLYPSMNKDKNILKQFINEGMTLMRLNHPNILKGLDFGISKGMYFLILEFIEGESLDSFLEKGFSFNESHAFYIISQVISALVHLEENKIVHRDIKPANILLIEDKVKLCDFAFALDISKIDKKEDTEEELNLTTCGTVEYISPEQARGLKNLDIRSDIYSLGITCLHMISGKLPFTDKNPQEVMRKQIYEEIKWDNFKISPSARFILEKMLSKDRNKRYGPKKLLHLIERYLKNNYYKK